MNSSSPRVARRRLIAAICSAALPLPLRPQSPPPKVIWFYQANLLGDPRERIRGHFKSIGLVDGRDVSLLWEHLPREDTFAPGFEDRLVSARPAAVVMIYGDLKFDALRTRVRDIPLLFYNMVRDPVALGFVQSLRRPGGNVTGTIVAAEDLNRKQWEMMMEFVPGMKRGGILHPKAVYETQNAMAERDPVMAVARRAYYDIRKSVTSDLGIEIADLPVPEGASVDEIEALVRGAGAQALSVAMALTPEILGFLKRSRIPSMGHNFRSVRNGLLLGSSFSWTEGEAHAATIVKQILRGVNPANIPVYVTKTFEFAVNRKTARESGIEIPASVLLRATEVYDG